VKCKSINLLMRDVARCDRTNQNRRAITFYKKWS